MNSKRQVMAKRDFKPLADGIVEVPVFLYHEALFNFPKLLMKTLSRALQNTLKVS